MTSKAELYWNLYSGEIKVTQYTIYKYNAGVSFGGSRLAQQLKAPGVVNLQQDK